jgi:hypothetical protein
MVMASAIPALVAVATTQWDVSFFGLFLIFYPFSLAATLLFGVPLFLLLERFGLVNIWSSSLSGFIIGVLASVAVVGPSQITLRYALFLSATGAAAAIAFWFCWSLKESQIEAKS